MGKETPKNWRFESANRTFGTDTPNVRTAAGTSGTDAPMGETAKIAGGTDAPIPIKARQIILRKGAG
jgi:hypothetical protein